MAPKYFSLWNSKLNSKTKISPEEKDNIVGLQSGLILRSEAKRSVLFWLSRPVCQEKKKRQEMRMGVFPRIKE